MKPTPPTQVSDERFVELNHPDPAVADGLHTDVSGLRGNAAESRTHLNERNTPAG